MPTYSSPGVYIEDVPPGPQPIAPAATSVVAVLGATRRGTRRRPTRVSSWSDFQRLFGGSAAGGFTAEAVYGFFANGGVAAYVVRVDPSTTATWTVLDSTDAASFTVTASSPGEWANETAVAVAPDLSGGNASLRFTLTVIRGEIVERFPGLSLDPADPVYYARDGVVNGVSTLVTVSRRAAGPEAVSDATTPARVLPDQRGQDLPPTPDDFRTGLLDLESQEEPAVVICPDLLNFEDELLQGDVVDAVVRHCESNRRFAILDAPDLPDQELLHWRSATVSSTYAAIYSPHLLIEDHDVTAPERFRVVPPSGFVAGVLARSDRDRGVHTAPGNDCLTGIVGLSQDYTDRQQDLLYPGGVNLIRSIAGRGTCIVGGRSATDDMEFRYVVVRRLFNFIQTSVERGTQWVVFEPNVPAVWQRIKALIEGFLNQQWRLGALAGNTSEQAYRVQVGLGQTMTESDVERGLVIIEVAIAPAKPAEFVVFRLSHQRVSA